jgi:type III secretory pathway component EscR
MHRFLTTLVLGAALVAPVGLRADDDHHEKDKHRYYDRDAKDWHEWNEQEQRAYRRYLEENHKRDLAWERARANEQRSYWKWRHKHPDAALYGDRGERDDRR